MANGPVFIRRFLTDQPDDIFLQIESVNILDLEPPPGIVAVGTGAACLAGEFENGPFNTPVEVLSVSDYSNTFGTFGYVYGGTTANNPCARQRSADAAIVPEFWNGNAFVQLNGKTYARLFLVRADTSTGSVQFQRQAFITGATSFRYRLANGQVLGLDIGAGDVDSTFLAAAATVTAVGGSYPTGFLGGETLTLSYDGVVFTVTFQAGDQTELQVIARINAFAGFTFAADSGGQIAFTGMQQGTGGSVAVVGASAAGVLTQLGLTVGSTPGTGNVANIAAVTVTEVANVVQTALGAANVLVQLDQNQALRISNTQTPLTGTITVTGTTTAAALGFTIGETSTAAVGAAGVIPAGTLVRDTGSTHLYVTMQDITTTVNDSGTYVVKVRPANDNGTDTGAVAGTITVVDQAPVVGSFAVINLSNINPALTEDQIDIAYQAALDATLDPGAVTAETNLIWSARQSNYLRGALKANVLTAATEGLQGRVCAVRPPLNTLKAVAKSSSAAPGVGATRDQRVIYCYPGVNTTVPAIKAVGTAGGPGFTADGSVDIGSDGLMISICSQLAPEENPGQLTSFTQGMNGLETGPNVQGFLMTDYISFKAAGIAAPRPTSGGLVFQSGVTSVDPTLNPTLVTIARRRMADYIQDTMADSVSNYGKKLSTLMRRKAIYALINSFLKSLLSPKNPAAQRIAAYSVNDSQNTAAQLGKGLYRITTKVQTLASLDAIVLATTIGETVVVDEVTSAAA